MKITRRTFVKTGMAAGAVAMAAPAVWKTGEMIHGKEAGGVATEEIICSNCWIGKQDCGLKARIVNGRPVRLEGNPDFVLNKGTLCPKGNAQITALYDPYRVKAPLERTNGKGQPGVFKEISWDAALAKVAKQIVDAQAVDPAKVVWQKGRSKAKGVYDNGFNKALGGVKLHHGAYCSDAGYRAVEYTIGYHGVLHPDMNHTNYMINMGWNLRNAGGNKFCWITWPQRFNAAKERGMRMVTLDPRLDATGPHVGEWLPIKPTTDLAFMLAVANVLIENGFVDAEYLTKYTNSCYLVKPDGTFKTMTLPVYDADGNQTYEEDDDGNPTTTEITADFPVVYDLANAEERIHEHSIAHLAPGAPHTSYPVAEDPELDGGHGNDKTGFRLYKEHVADRTPEWAEAITSIPASKIREVALDFGHEASIGATIEMDGHTLPYRPVGIMAYHVAQSELGFQTIRQALMVSMLVGAIEAVGGQRIDMKHAPYKNYGKLDKISIGDSDFGLYLDKSKFYPINSNLTGLTALAMRDYEDGNPWQIKVMPEVVIIHHCNPRIAFPDTKVIHEAYMKWKFCCVIDPWLSETADYYADIVLPASTLEKWEGPVKKNDGTAQSLGLRAPLMEPIFDSKGDMQIYLELAAAVDVIDPNRGMLNTFYAKMNKELGLSEYALEDDATYTEKEVYDRWAKEQGHPEGADWYAENGVENSTYSVTKMYGTAQDPPFTDAEGAATIPPGAQIIGRLYGADLLRYQKKMRELLDASGGNKTGFDSEIFYQDYTAFPTWREPTLFSSPAEYDLLMISHKMIEFKQARTTFTPMLKELAPKQMLRMSVRDGKAKGLDDGDTVTITSHHAITGETRKLVTEVMLTEGMRPGVVSLPHHYGFWVNPRTRDMGPAANDLFFTGPGYVSMTADQCYHVMVSITKGGSA